MRDPVTIDGGHDLFLRMAKLCDGHPRDDVLQVCINLISNCVRQHAGLRTEAEALMSEVYGRNMAILMENYDPVTNRRRSVVPFTQTVTMEHHHNRKGGGNGRT